MVAYSRTNVASFVREEGVALVYVRPTASLVLNLT